MDLKAIGEILQSNNPDFTKQYQILEVLSKDETVIEKMMLMLSFERKRKRELILEINMQLSRADTALQSPILNKDGFITDEIKKFYKEHKKELGHCFKNPEDI